MVEFDGEELRKDGSTVAHAAFRPLCRRAGEVVAGRVLELGLGIGITRRHLYQNEAVETLETVEIEPEIIQWWRQNAPEAAPEDLRAKLTRANAATRLEEAVTNRERFDAILVDIDELPRNQTVRQTIRTLLNRLGCRLVIQFDRDDLTLNGFKVTRDQTTNGRSLYICDRWDPAAGLGTDRPRRVIRGT